MAARAIWKASVCVGDVRVPVKLFSAIEDRTVHFRLLHERDHTPIEQRMVHPETLEPVPYGDAQRGFMEGKDSLVVLEKNELAQLEPKESRDIEIVQFVKPEALPQQLYERPYYLGPDGPTKAYFALVNAIEAEGRIGVARWVMRKKEYAGALRVQGGYLSLLTLRSVEEVIASSQLPKPKVGELNPKEVAMAEQLVAMFEDTFDPSSFRDEYRERVLAFVEAKAAGKTVRMGKFKPRQLESNLSRVLEESLRKAKQLKAGTEKSSGATDSESPKAKSVRPARHSDKSRAHEKVA
ncbi:MAG TPA: Ku protein [Polyangiaceae bacterium]|nr:Ku protein [Polyangiaceae bacterium]